DQPNAGDVSNASAAGSGGPATCDRGRPPAGCGSAACTTAGSGAPTAVCLPEPVPHCCTSDAQCDNGNACDGMETCVNHTCVGGTPLQCNDGKPCNGVETCDPVNGCQPGTPPNCDAGAPCTMDSCDDAAPGDGCVHHD